MNMYPEYGVYTPSYAEGLGIYFAIIDPDPLLIEIQKIQFNGEDLPEYVQSHLLDTKEDQFKEEICTKLRSRMAA